MSGVKLNLLGGFRGTGADGSDLVFPTRKARLLLAYLAIPAGQEHGRDKLIGLLWGERGDEQARGSLRNALSGLRKVLGKEAIRTDGDRVSLAPEALEIDVAAFEALCADTAPSSAEQAAALYAGDLLENLVANEPAFEEWLDIERRRLQEMGREVMCAQMRQQAETGDFSAALKTGQQILAGDPFQEPIQRAVIWLLAAEGQRGNAIQHFESYRKQVAADLGVDLEPQTQDLLKLVKQLPANELIREGLSGLLDGCGSTPPAATAAYPAARPPQDISSPDRLSIAVLPFGTPSGDPDDEDLSEGLNENICAILYRFRWLRVAASPASSTGRGTATDAMTAAADLGVRYVISGNLRRSGERFRFSVQLMDGRNGDHVWAERYDRETGDVLGLQDELASLVAGAVAPELEEAERQWVARLPLQDLDTWELYQRGRWHLYRFTPKQNAEARRIFQMSIDSDPKFSAAYAGYAYACHLAVIMRLSDSLDEMLVAALKAARRAVALDDKDAFAHSVLAQVYVMNGDHDQGVAEAEVSVRLNPASARSHYSLGWVRTFTGDAKGAIVALDRARKLSPHDPNLWSIYSVRAIAHFVDGNFEDAAEWARRAARRPNALFGPWATLAAALGQLGRTGEAEQAVEQLLERRADFTTGFAAGVLPFQHEIHGQAFLDGLREAGLQEQASIIDDSGAAEPQLPASGSDTTLDRPGIAVLPFANQSGDPAQDFFVDGISEDLITGLSRYRGLLVIGRNTCFSFKGKAPDHGDLARELGIDFVLEGSVRKQHDRVRISANLTDIESGRQVWAEQFDHDLADIFAIQDQVTRAIVAVLPRQVEAAGLERLRRRAPGNLAAYECLLQGKDHHRRATKDDNLQAEALFKRAISLDPSDSQAHAWLSCTYGQGLVLGFREAARETWAACIEHAEQAEQLDDHDSEAHRVLCEIRLALGDHDQAWQHHQRAFALNPNDPRLFIQRADFLTWDGKAEDGLAWIDEAVRLDPHYPGIDPYYSGGYDGKRGIILFAAGRYREAADVLRRIPDPTARHHAVLAGCYAHLNDGEEAARNREETLRLMPDFTIDRYMKTIPYRDGDARKHHIDALKLAGLT